MKVAEFRRQIEHVNRIARLDYSQAVGEDEKTRCVEILRRVTRELTDSKCPRAKWEDVQNMERAVDNASRVVTSFIDEYHGGHAGVLKTL